VIGQSQKYPLESSNWKSEAGNVNTICHPKKNELESV
jgi:hypothetical protein